MNTAIIKAIEVCGGAAELARAIGKSRQFVHEMKTGRKPIPVSLARTIADATSGKVPVEALRPDLWWGGERVIIRDHHEISFFEAQSPRDMSEAVWRAKRGEWADALLALARADPRLADFDKLREQIEQGAVRV